MSGAKKLRYVAVGALLGLFCALLSVAVAGGGHGWNSAWTARESRALNMSLAGAAIVLDAGLLARTWSEGFGYFVAVWPLAAAWLVLWFGWQALAWRNCLRSAG